MKKILVIFDCFGVLCEPVVSKFLRGRASEEDIAYFSGKFSREGDLGKVSREEFFKQLSGAVNMTQKEAEEALKDYYVLHEPLVGVIEKIRAFADTALLSNAFFGHAEMVLDGLDTRRLFDKVFISSSCGVAKPDPAFYQICLDSFDGEYEAIYMVDDTDNNLEPLPELGILPIKYTCASDVEKALEKYFE